MSGPLHVSINGCVLYVFNIDNTSFALFPLKVFLYVLQNYRAADLVVPVPIRTGSTPKPISRHL